MEEEARDRRRSGRNPVADPERGHRLPRALTGRRRAARHAAARQSRAGPPPRRERISAREAEFPDHAPRQGLHASDAGARLQDRARSPANPRSVSATYFSLSGYFPPALAWSTTLFDR